MSYFYALVIMIATALAGCCTPAVEDIIVADCVAPPHGTVYTVSESDGGASCLVGLCEPGWGDCDGNPEDGCENDLTSKENCGACENQCADTQQCVKGTCVPVT